MKTTRTHRQVGERMVVITGQYHRPNHTKGILPAFVDVEGRRCPIAVVRDERFRKRGLFVLELTDVTKGFDEVPHEWVGGLWKIVDTE
jgi:hypothetical protein